MSEITDLKSAGLKATLPRMQVLEILQQSERRHLTADDVYRIAITQGNDIGLATIYRVLTQFEQAGLVHKSTFDAGKAVFELNEGGHHDHLVCLDCGHVEEFVDESIEKKQQEISRQYGFELDDHVMALYGRCKREACPNRKQSRTPL